MPDNPAHRREGDQLIGGRIEGDMVAVKELCELLLDHRRQDSPAMKTFKLGCGHAAFPAGQRRVATGALGISSKIRMTLLC
jgi:hypothetical protein